MAQRGREQRLEEGGEVITRCPATDVVTAQIGEGGDAIYPFYVHMCRLPEGHFQVHRGMGDHTWPSEKWEQL